MTVDEPEKPPIVGTSSLYDRVVELERGICDFLAGDYPHPRKYRPNKCPHGTDYWQECAACDEAHFENLLGKPQGHRRKLENND
jgi:hypothetical protein